MTNTVYKAKARARPGRLLLQAVLLLGLGLASQRLAAQPAATTWVRLGVIGVASPALADSLLQRLHAGENFYDLAARFSLAPNAAVGGEQSWIAVNSLPPPAQPLIGGLEPGRYLPLTDPAGWYLIIHKLGQGTEDEARQWDLRFQAVYRLKEEAQAAFRAGDYATADSLLPLVVPLQEALLGPHHPEVAGSLNDVAIAHRRRLEYAEAEATHQQAITRLEDARLTNHPFYGNNLYNLGASYYDQGRFQAADSLYRRALHIRETTLHATDLRIARSLTALGVLRREQGDYPAADSLLQRAYQASLQNQGPDHPEAATGALQLGLLYGLMGRFQAADSLLQQAVRIYDQNNLPASIASGLQLRGQIALDQGDYPKAKAFFQESLRIREEVLGPNDLKVGNILHSLAILYQKQADYATAERLLLRALDIARNGTRPSSLATGLLSLAILYTQQGNYEKATPYIHESLQIRQEALGPDHPELAFSLHELALAYQRRRDYHTADSLHRRALAIRERALGPDHPEVATSLGHLASIADPVESDALYERILAIQEQRLDAGHPELARTLHNRAHLQRIQRDFTAAHALFDRALRIREDALGPDHPDVAETLVGLALASMGLNRPREALAYLQRTAQIETPFLQHILAYSTEAEKLAFLRTLPRRLDLMLALALDAPSTSQEAVEAAFALLVQRKGVTLDASAQQLQLASATDDSLSLRLAEQLRSLSQQIAQHTFSGRRSALQVADLRERREQVEDSLAQRSGLFRQATNAYEVDASRIAATLPAGSVLLEFAQFTPFDLGPEPAAGHRPRYAAFALTSAGRLHLVDLGPAAAIDSLIFAYQQGLRGADQLGTLQLRDAAQRLTHTAHALYQSLLAPLQAALPEEGTLYCAPDGLLHLLPFDVLVDDAQRYLVERYQFNYLGSGRDLLRFAAAEAPRPRDTPYVFADADFDAHAETPASTATASSSEAAVTARRSRAWQGTLFTPLPGTAAEAHAIQDLFDLDDAHLVLNHEATEPRLLHLQAPRLLHIATHGFFLKSQYDPAGTDPPFASWVSQAPQHAVGALENPLLRSGLALAGANHVGTPRQETQRHDGIVTALEITGMNLQGTELVVLSACETGLGQVRTGEGVFGLRRAFLLAGAQTVVMSLWKVPDAETSDLMIAFYRHLHAGAGPTEALRAAMLDRIRQLRAERGLAHPYFWGAFISAGNPR